MRRPLRTLVFAALLLHAGTKPTPAQGTPENKPTDGIRGVVVNSVTHEPIGRALVYVGDNRFATMTDSEGRFEFIFPQAGSSQNNNEAGGASYSAIIRPGLMARKPGFVGEQTIQSPQLGKDLTLSLTPEALVVGRVVLPTSEASDAIQLELYRRQVVDGRAHWILAGSASTKSNGQFRFAELPAGSYKLLTREMMDRDPLTFDPRGQLWGYPPVYFPNASDFSAAHTMQLAAGQIFQADISLVRRAYYPVKVPIGNAPTGSGMAVVVSVQGHRGPGFALGYNNRDQTIEGLLPNGNYTLEASSFGPTAASGVLNISVRGSAVEGSRMTLLPNGSIGVNIKEEFISTEDANSPTVIKDFGAPPVAADLPRRYLNLRLEPADDFGQERGAWLRPAKSEDDSAAIDGVQPGRYWVRVDAARGFVASMTSGTTDLQHQLLVVGLGGSSAPIEITMRDSTAEIDGTIEGMATSFSGTAGASPSANGIAGVSPDVSAHVYCVPLPDSSGEFRDVWVAPDGKFGLQNLAPGTYRVLAFDHPQPELEYRNPEVMRACDAKGQLVHLIAGQKEHLHLPLTSTSE